MDLQLYPDKALQQVVPAPRAMAPSPVQALAQFAPISLAAMDAVALLNRTDTKYVLTMRQLRDALSNLAGRYRVLEIDGVRLNAYQSLYFDTADFALYMLHHAGKRNRCKVRSRRYVGTNQSFLEVKLKTSKERTVKQRIATGAFATHFTPELEQFLGACAPLPSAELEPKLWNEFSRITLVGSDPPERLTLDLNLRFYNASASIALPELAIAEVKQEGHKPNSAFIQQMRAAHIQPMGFSKYCIGVALLYPDVKHNSFKPRLRLIEKLTGVTSNVY